MLDRLACVRAGLALALVGLALPGWAQIRTGDLLGRVSDASGAAVAGADVTVDSEALLAPRRVQTGPTGAYHVPALPSGAYTVTVEHPGFTRAVREAVVVEAGFHAAVDVELTVAGLTETVVVAVAAPVVDPTRASAGETFVRAHLDAVPSARDPWALLGQTANVLMDRPNVGGSRSGDQAFFTAHGGNQANTMWSVDGVTITDLAQTGASPAFYDFDAFDEVRVNTAGNDASLQTGGVSINLITRGGGNRLRGTARAYTADRAWQADNVTPDLRRDGAGAGNPIDNVSDYGGEAGGPIRADRAWFWGAYGRQDVRVGVLGFLRPGATDPNDPDSLQTDHTRLTHLNGKVEWQWRASRKLTALVTRSQKQRNAVNASTTRPFETTQRQRNPTTLYKIAEQWVAGGRWLIDAHAAHVDYDIDFDVQSPALADVQRLQDLSTGIWGRSWIRVSQRRPQTEVRADAHGFLSGFAGGDHTFRTGVRYRRTPERGTRYPGGLATARVDGGMAVEADLHRPAAVEKAMSGWSLYASDSYERARLRLNLGVRLDYQDDRALPSTTGENPIVPDWLPAVSFAGADAGVSYLDLSPRLGATVDLRGDGRTIVKAAGAVYYGQGIFTAEELTPGGDITTVRFPWRDLNGDRFVQRDELDLQRLLLFTPNYDPRQPASVSTATTVDPGLGNDRTAEILAGVEHELWPHTAAGVLYVWRRYDRFSWSPKLGLSSRDFVPVTATFACGNATCAQPSSTVTYYELARQLPAADRLTNRDAHRGHHGWEISLRRRQHGRWLAHASLGFNDTRQYLDEFEDPTNVAQMDGAQDNERNARWTGKLTGVYALPAGWRVAGFFSARQGYPYLRTVRSPARRGGLGRINVLLDRFGDVRHDPLVTLDLRVERAFPLRRARAVVSLDVFNVGNANTVLQREGVQNLATANAVVEILAPRIARVGLRVGF